jgi:hypothetical protein
MPVIPLVVAEAVRLVAFKRESTGGLSKEVQAKFNAISKIPSNRCKFVLGSEIDPKRATNRWFCGKGLWSVWACTKPVWRL